MAGCATAEQSNVYAQSNYDGMTSESKSSRANAIGQASNEHKIPDFKAVSH